MMNSNSLHNMARKYHRRLMLFGGLVTAILVTACLLMLLVLGACTNEALVSDAGTEIGTDTNALRFDISIAPAEELENTAEEPGTTRSRTCVTRAVTDAAFRTTFETGDAIGIFAINADNGNLAATGNPIHNARLTYDAATGTWQGNIYWPVGFTGALKFYAYYPYDDCGGRPETLNPTAYRFRAMTDQNATATAATAGRDPYSLSDLMGACSTGYSKADLSPDGPNPKSVSLSFRHLMAMVQVSVPAGNKTSGPDKNLIVKLNNVLTEAHMNLNTLSPNGNNGNDVAPANPQSDPVTLFMRRVEQPADADYTTTYTYRALLPAQDLPPGTRLISMEQEPWLLQDAPLESKLTLTSACAETFVRALPATAMKMVKIQAGTFMMGSSDGTNVDNADGTGLNLPPEEIGREEWENQHWVTLTQDFYFSQYEVTNEQFVIFLNATHCGEDGVPGSAPATNRKLQTVSAAMTLCRKDPDGTPVPVAKGYESAGCTAAPATRQNGNENPNILVWDKDNQRWTVVPGTELYPAVGMTWLGARRFAIWLGCDLPTEAQWEYACRAGTTTPYYFGDIGPYDGEYDNRLQKAFEENAWFYYNSGGLTHEVGQKKPNPWGLYDMYGNAAEYCLDTWDGYSPYDVNNSTDPVRFKANDEYHIVRGGSIYTGTNKGSSLRGGVKYQGGSAIGSNFLGGQYTALGTNIESAVKTIQNASGVNTLVR